MRFVESCQECSRESLQGSQREERKAGESGGELVGELSGGDRGNGRIRRTQTCFIDIIRSVLCYLSFTYFLISSVCVLTYVARNRILI